MSSDWLRLENVRLMPYNFQNHDEHIAWSLTFSGFLSVCQSTKTDVHYYSFHLTSVKMYPSNFQTHDWPLWSFPGFTLWVWPKPRVQKDSLRRYYSFNLTNVKPNDSSTGLLAQNYVWPQWPLWTHSLWFHYVCVTWAVPRYCSFLKCQPLSNCSSHGANFAQSDTLQCIVQIVQCIVQTTWRSKTKVTWNEKTCVGKNHLHQLPLRASHLG